MNVLRPVLLSLLCLGTLNPLAASELPSLGDATSGIVSRQQEYQLGRAWLGMLRGQVKTLSDPLLKDFVENSVYRLAETSQLEDRRLEFILMDDPQINAFAAPGGIIGVNGGLFLHAESEAEYASVLAHELAHLSQRHFARGLEAQQRMQLPVMAAMLAGLVAAAAGAADAGMAAIASSQAAAIQNQLRFSRQNEQEADRIGLVNLAKAGYDPRSMSLMFSRLARQYRYGSKPPEFLLTHPVSESRMADTRNRAEQYAEGGREDSLRYQLMRARMQLQYEETPGMAAKRFRALLDEQPGLDAARYGLALAQSRTGQLAPAADTLAPLLAKAPNEIIYNLAQVEIDIAAKRFEPAGARIDRLLKRYPNNFPLKQAKAELMLTQGRIDDAVRLYDELSSSRPDDPDIWYEVAEVRGLAKDIVGLHQARAEFFTLVGSFKQALEQLDYAKRRSGGNFQLASRIDAREQAIREQEKVVKDMMR